MSIIFRQIGHLASLAITASSSTAAQLVFSSYAGGMVHVPSGSSITSLTWYGSDDGTTYYAIQDGAGTAVVTTVAAGQAAPIPTACFAAAYLKAVGNTTGTVHITLKT